MEGAGLVETMGDRFTEGIGYCKARVCIFGVAIVRIERGCEKGLGGVVGRWYGM